MDLRNPEIVEPADLVESAEQAMLDVHAWHAAAVEPIRILVW
jgi:hypothetical protein